MTQKYNVERYSTIDPVTRLPSGDFLKVGDRDLGDTRRIAHLEHARAKVIDPRDPVGHMRPMFYTGSPWGREILALVDEREGGGDQ